MNEDEEMMTEEEDELTEQMIAAVQALKEHQIAQLLELKKSYQDTIKEKDARISTLSSEVSTLKSEMRKLAEKIESLNKADLVLKDNERLIRENRALQESVSRIQALTSHAEELRQAAKDFPEAITALRRAERAVSESNSAVRVELSEATEKAAQGLLEPITENHKKQLHEIAEKANDNLFSLIFTKWILIIVLVLFIGTSGFVGYKLYDNREALGRVGTAVNQILQIEKTRQGGQ